MEVRCLGHTHAGKRRVGNNQLTFSTVTLMCRGNNESDLADLVVIDVRRTGTKISS